jgi:hypothetical protein
MLPKQFLIIVVMLILFVAAVSAAGWQSPAKAAGPMFEVASVKRSSPAATPATPSTLGKVLPGGVWRAEFATVYGLIRIIWLRASSITTVRDWRSTLSMNHN